MHLLRRLTRCSTCKLIGKRETSDRRDRWIWFDASFVNNPVCLLYRSVMQLYIQCQYQHHLPDFATLRVLNQWRSSRTHTLRYIYTYIYTRILPVTQRTQYAISKLTWPTYISVNWNFLRCFNLFITRIVILEFWNGNSGTTVKLDYVDKWMNYQSWTW